jgi:hypothetical protein
MPTQHTPNIEIGNLIFGNSRGNHHVDRSLQDTFYILMETIEKIDPNFDPDYGSNNNPYHEGKNLGFKNNTFLIRPYYWGDCDCGYDQEDEKQSKNEETYVDWLHTHDHEEDCSLGLNNFEYFPTGYTLQ